jgi:chaperonin GroES
MSIKSLINNIGKANLAEDLDETLLTAIGSRVKRQYEEDWASMTDWVTAVQNGIELMKQEYSGKSYPWEGASNYKDPILTEASTVFGDKASLELLRSKDLVSAAVIGRDPEGKKKAICERISEAMNYQVNYDMDGWRDDQERLFYCLPVVGSVFKKVVYDPVEKTCESIVINYPDFAVNQATKSMSRCRSFTHVLEFSLNEVNERVRCGKWIDPEVKPANANDPDKRMDQGSNEAEGVIDAVDNPERYLEQHTFYDIDGDGYEEPYIITIKASSGKVCRILPRYDERSIIVEFDDKYMPVQEVIQIEQEALVADFGGAETVALLDLPVPEIDANKYTLIKVVPFQNVVKYGFITSPDNTFLDLGYSHLLGALTMNINTTTNQINDRTTLNILGGGWLAKEFRIKQGFMRFRMGEYKQTEVPADKLAKGIFPQPLQEPSQTAYQMRADMQARANGFLAVVDVSGKIQANTAPTTALAIIQEAIIPTTALFKRILSAESKEFQILFRINQATFPKDKYQRILDDPQADPQADFNYDTLDVVPTANAEMASKMHRIQTAQLEMEQIPLILQMGGNPVPIVKSFFDAIGSELVDAIFPDDGSLSPADQKARQQMLQAQEQANKIAELQLQILTREQDRLDLKTAEDIKKIQAEVKKLGADMIETLANAAKLGEQAESESTKNQISIYTAQLQTITSAIDALGAMNDRALQIPQFAPPSNNVGAVPGMAQQPMLR